MDLEQIKTNIEEAIYNYEKADKCNFFYQNISDLKWVLGMLEEL